MKPIVALLVTGAALALASCGDHAGDRAATPSAAVVDSVFPMDMMLARFRRDVPQVEALRSGTGSRDGLVNRVVAALESADTLALEVLAIDRAEFAWLYYPTAPTAQPPYELPPALAWFQLQEANRKGVFRALHELGGRRLGFRGYECGPEPDQQGENRVWTGCRVRIQPEGEDARSIALFGAIIERDGRFAVLSYDNDF